MQKYKRLWEMMNDDQKRMATVVNTASGRKFLRGGTNEFGSVQQKKDLQPNIYSRFKGLMEGLEEDITDMEEEEGETYDDLEKILEQDIHEVEEGNSEVKSVGKDIDKGHKVGDKVFGKIYGFPPWPAELIETNAPPGKMTVVFVDGSVGRNATTLTFNEENFIKLVKTSKFKKTGSGSKASFLADCKCWGLSLS